MSAPIWKGLPVGTLTYLPDSGQMKLAERITVQQKFAGRYNDCLLFAVAHPRGSIWTITFNGAPNLFQVEDCDLDAQKGGKGFVTVNYLFLGLTPPDEFSLTPFEINPPIERNAFFATLSEDDLNLARGLLKPSSDQALISIMNAVNASANKTLIQSLANKWLKGEETYYLAGFKFQHTIYSFTAPNGDAGGYIQAPFGAFAGYIGAGLNVSWLRQSDEVVWANGLWKLTRTWIGGPPGQWDPDLYSAN